MNAYLAALWLINRATMAVIFDKLDETKVWQDSAESQRTLWTFVAALIDPPRIEPLWIYASNDDRRAVLGRALAERADREGRILTRPPVTVSQAAEGV